MDLDARDEYTGQWMEQLTEVRGDWADRPGPHHSVLNLVPKVTFPDGPRRHCLGLDRKGTMSNLPHIAKTQISKFPEVTALVVTDDAGSLLEASGDIDSEAIGAVHVVTMQALSRCGSVLGLGALSRLTITGTKRACLIAVHDHDVVGIYVDPTKPIGAFEKKLEAALRR
jgi:predicted regulator of Ras-like GTPase activity (Roadblock/LC7/MglB family)